MAPVVTPAARPSKQRSTQGASSVTKANPDLVNTTFTPIGLLNAKHVASNFQRSESQAWLARRPSDALWDKEREAKRRRLMASEEEIQEVTTQQQPANGVTGEARATDARPKLNVLSSKSTGSIKPAIVDHGAMATADSETESDLRNKTIIIQPGSKWLRIGRASDESPTLVANVIARRMPERVQAKRLIPKIRLPTLTALGNKALPTLPPLSSTSKASVSNQQQQQHNEDDEIDELEDSDADEGDQTPSGGGSAQPDDGLTDKINSIRVDLRQRMRAFKLRGTTGGNQIAADYNATVEPEEMKQWHDQDEIHWTDATKSDAADVFIGQAALTIPDAEAAGYLLRRPFSRGGLNTTDYTVLHELMGDLETMYTFALEKELGILRHHWPEYSVIFLIPDLYDYVYVREMTDLLLRTMGFKQICVQQESLAATIGAGSSSSCVVDIGARLTTITCIEDGLVVPETREADLSRWHDWKVLEDLKEQMVVLGENDVGVNLIDFYVRTPSKPTLKYSIRYYDDAILAPYALFAPRVVDFDSKNETQQALWIKAVDDAIDVGSTDVTQATRAMTNSVRHLLPATTTADLQPARDAGAAPLPAEAATPVKESASVAAAESAGPTVDVRVESSKIPLDVAVVESIMACGTEDRMKKAVANLVVTGGCSAIHNAGFAISSRVTASLSVRMPSLASSVNVVVPPKDMDSKHLAWKGLSNLVLLPHVANDLWVRNDEWSVLGMKAVKDRVFYFA
ncbi:actin-like protein arp8 [Microbotryomycetes sp. JL221]|nr:actin-like protein arp8 [Microbotryomycetes sp. JL221]